MNIFQRCACWLFAGIFISLYATPVRAANDFYEVIAIEKSGYLAYPDRGLKKSLVLGERLERGNTIAVNRGNYVQIAVDESRQNVLHIQGEALAELTGSLIKQINLSEGELFVFLDHLRTVPEVQVDTPSASIYAKDAYVKIKTNGKGTEARVYKGEASITGRLPNGTKMTRKVTLRAGEKASIGAPGQDPTGPVRMKESEFNEIKAAAKTGRVNKQILVFPELYVDQKSVAPSQARTAPSSNLVTKTKDEDKKSDRGVFFFQ